MANELTKRVMQRIVERSGRTYQTVEQPIQSCMPQAGNVHLTAKEISHLSGLLHKQPHSSTDGHRLEASASHSGQGGNASKQSHSSTTAGSVTLPSGGGRLKLDDLVKQVKK